MLTTILSIRDNFTNCSILLGEIYLNVRCTEPEMEVTEEYIKEPDDLFELEELLPEELNKVPAAPPPPPPSPPKIHKPVPTVFQTKTEPVKVEKPTVWKDPFRFFKAWQ